MDKTAIGRRVRTLRDAQGLSQDDLAQKAGVHRNTVSNVETDHYSTVTLETLSVIAGALGVDVGVLAAPDVIDGAALVPAQSTVE